MAEPTLSPEDEHAHEPGPEPLWNESWYLDFLTPDGSLGGYVRVGLYPNLGTVWYWACLVGAGRPLVTVIDHTVPMPRDRRSLELRTDGLWADHHVGTPLEHMTLGLEAFGVALDDPAEAYRGLRGVRTPLGFDLEWETDGLPYRYPAVLDRYEVPCTVHGTIQVGDETIELDGIGQRDHSWGVRDWWAVGWCWSAWRRGDGGRVHAVTTIPPLGFAVGYRQRAGDLTPVEAVEVEPADHPEGLAPSVRLVVDGLGYDVEPLAWAPVPLVGPEGQSTRFPRALCRFRGDDGDVGLGWLELNEQQPV